MLYAGVTTPTWTVEGADESPGDLRLPSGERPAVEDPGEDDAWRAA